MHRLRLDTESSPTALSRQRRFAQTLKAKRDGVNDDFFSEPDYKRQTAEQFGARMPSQHGSLGNSDIWPYPFNSLVEWGRFRLFQLLTPQQVYGIGRLSLPSCANSRWSCF